MNYFNSIIEFREVIFEKTMFFSLKNTKLTHATFYRCGTTIFLLSEVSEKLKVNSSFVYIFESKICYIVNNSFHWIFIKCNSNHYSQILTIIEFI